jgi:CRISPR-associated protein Cas1
MKQLQNVLYILTPGSYLFCQNEAIAVKVGGEDRALVPSHVVESIVCFGNTTVSTPFIGFCAEKGIALSFLSEYGRFYGRVQGPAHGNVLLRTRQYAMAADPVECVAIVSNLLYGKIANARQILLRAAREHADELCTRALGQAAERLAESARSIKDAGSVAALRGIEGYASKEYFAAFPNMVKSVGFDFSGRTRRPPEDPVNALMSFLYALLKNDVQSALESVGLDPAVGFLHALRPGRPALALDMMEELRAPLCDRLVLSLINRRMLDESDFSREAGGVLLSEKARRLVIDSWQKRKKEEIRHPFFGEKMAIGLIPFAQAMLLARWVRGDLDQYPPFHWR